MAEKSPKNDSSILDTTDIFQLFTFNSKSNLRRQTLTETNLA